MTGRTSLPARRGNRGTPGAATPGLPPPGASCPEWTVRLRGGSLREWSQLPQLFARVAGPPSRPRAGRIADRPRPHRLPVLLQTEGFTHDVGGEDGRADPARAKSRRAHGTPP